MKIKFLKRGVFDCLPPELRESVFPRFRIAQYKGEYALGVFTDPMDPELPTFYWHRDNPEKILGEKLWKVADGWKYLGLNGFDLERGCLINPFMTTIPVVSVLELLVDIGENGWPTKKESLFFFEILKEQVFIGLNPNQADAVRELFRRMEEAKIKYS